MGGTNFRWIYLVHRPRRPVTIAINPLLTPPLLSPLPHAPPPYLPSKLESPNLPIPTHHAPSPPYKPPTPLHSRFAPACGRRPPAPRRTTQTTARDTRTHVPSLRIPSLCTKTDTRRPPGRFLCADGPSPLRVLFLASCPRTRWSVRFFFMKDYNIIPLKRVRWRKCLYVSRKYRYI